MYTPLEQPCEVLTGKRRVSIGIPAAASAGEHRFPLTPEGAGMLCERGFEVRMESGASADIHFDDEDYRVHGVCITTRREALGADIVLHLPPIAPPDAEMLKPGAVLLGLLHASIQSPMAVRTLLRRHVIAIALDLVADPGGNHPFADILSEVDGRAAIALASAMLANPVSGKGILLGGIPGIVPCEVTIIGAGIAARAAAQSALGLGAIVKMFDNDVYRLREALHELGNQQVIGSSLHPRVFASALRSADVMVATPTRHPVELSLDIVSEMKRGVIAFDLSTDTGSRLLADLECVDIATADLSRRGARARVRSCYINPGSAVPRTAAMALSTTLLTFFEDVIVCDGLSNALRFNRGISAAAYTFLGKVVNPAIAALIGQKPLDINLLLQFT